MELKIFTKALATKENFLSTKIAISYDGLENEINQWLAAKPNIHINHITQSQSGGSMRKQAVLTVCLWYTAP